MRATEKQLQRQVFILVDPKLYVKVDSTYNCT